ncbi:hypothetical protein [Aquirhabdus sp.]|uniref:hypothetical protein n=1 Tax=Aquirhabdus sp. TaxID=2824160 RepID=UPI00396CE063
MSINAPFLASTVQDRITTELEGLYQRTRSRVSDADKKLGLELLIEANCDLLDTCFGSIFEELSRLQPSKDLLDANAVIEDIKSKARHYIRWIGPFISNDRLPPVIAHYYTLMHQMDLGSGSKPYMAFNITTDFAAVLKQALAKLADGRVTDVQEIVDLLVEVFDETLQPLLIRPKELMKFNFVVNKTLDGVISIVKMLNKHMLRKLAPSIPMNLYPVVARHLEEFLIA